MYRVETLTNLGVKYYPPFETIEDVWLDISGWELPENYYLTYCKSNTDYQNWLDGFEDVPPGGTWNGGFPVWITESYGEVEFETTKKGYNRFLWDAHFHDDQKAEIVRIYEKKNF